MTTEEIQALLRPGVKFNAAASWWNKFTKQQQRDYIYLLNRQSQPVNTIRKFITATNKKFGDADREVYQNLSVSAPAPKNHPDEQTLYQRWHFLPESGRWEL